MAEGYDFSLVDGITFSDVLPNSSSGTRNVSLTSGMKLHLNQFSNWNSHLHLQSGMWIEDHLYQETKPSSYFESLSDGMRMFDGDGSRGEFWQIRSKSRIWFTTEKPDNYWAGDTGTVTFPEGYGADPYGVFGYGEATFLKYEIFVLSNTDKYIDLALALLYEAPTDSIVYIYKDNIKKETFSYTQIPHQNTHNRIDVVYRPRILGYIKDVITISDEYDIETYQELRKQSIEMLGIKRRSQAQRMAAFLLDYNCYINWQCSFETDILGVMLCLGDIVGVTHPAPNWIAKLFRVVSSEEMQDFEVKLELTEYVPSVYHDNAVPYPDTDVQSENNTPINRAEVPQEVVNFEIIEDCLNPVLHIAFSNPEDQSNYFMGAMIYRQNPDTLEWSKVDMACQSTASAPLWAAVGLADTTIYYDPVNAYDSFPESGTIWIDSEMITYNGIDDVLGAFYNCVRGVNNTQTASHVVGEICVFYQDSLLTMNYDVKNDVGKTFTYKAIAITCFGIFAQGINAPTCTLSIYGYTAYPFSVGDLNWQEQ
jgi:hypothetical protein